MAIFEYRTRGDFEYVRDALNEGVMNSAASIRLVEESNIACERARVCVRVYDQYFMRNSSRASLTLAVVAEDGEICITAIGAGGGQGVIFNFSYGSESKLVRVVENIVRDRGL